MNPEAQPVKLGDIAKVEAVTEQGEYTRYDGKDALSMAITKSKTLIRLKWPTKR